MRTASGAVWAGGVWVVTLPCYLRVKLWHSGVVYPYGRYADRPFHMTGEQNRD